jgi:hypothetical protein
MFDRSPLPGSVVEEFLGSVVEEFLEKLTYFYRWPYDGPIIYVFTR